MIAIITGDIVSSQSVKTDIWNDALSRVLSTLGPQPQRWDIFRGDSFQARVDNPADAMRVAVQIKATMKMIKGLDMRMAIGIGDIEYEGKDITESNGSAFIHSGRLFDELPSMHQRLAIRSPWSDLDECINLPCKLACITMNKWLANAAEVMQYILLNPNASQSETGKALGIAQNTVSERFSRAYKEEILAFIAFYETQIQTWLK